MLDLHNPMRQWLEALNARLEILTVNQTMSSLSIMEVPTLLEKPVTVPQTQSLVGSTLT
jgi:hypothetical protein